MTAEIAILNRQAIALAADSAVTIGSDRVWKNTNKLFSLGPANDIAVMIWGSGEFVGFPWEILVKTFRAEVGGKKFRTVADCGAAFVSFLQDKRFSADDLNRGAHLAIFLEPLENLKAAVLDGTGESEAKKLILSACTDFIADAGQQPLIDGAPSLGDFSAAYKAPIKALAEDVFGQTVSGVLHNQVTKALHEFVRRQFPSGYETGVVIAGYGSDEFFPSLREYIVDGKDDQFARIWLDRDHDTNKPKSTKTMVLPFGQVDIFYLFMEGIVPEYLDFIGEYLSKILNDKSDRIVKDYVQPREEALVEQAKQRKDNSTIRETFLKEFAAFRQELVVQKIVDVVRSLPKEEMADLASAMVELTSLRRRIDSPLESVGGPVDIAIISKGDGVIWIRRKHYFDIERNREFLYRKLAQRREPDANDKG